MESGNGFDVVNKEFLDKERRQPKHHFVAVPKNRDVFGQSHYENLGYVVVPLTPEGPRFRGISAPQKGQSKPVQEYRGCILMQIDMDVYEDICKYGETGQGGTESLERLDRMISNPDNVQHQGKWVHEANETKPSEFVLEQ